MFCFILSNTISKWPLKKCLWYLSALWFPTDPVEGRKLLLGLAFTPVQVGTFPAWSQAWGWCPFNRLWVVSSETQKDRCAWGLSIHWFPWWSYWQNSFNQTPSQVWLWGACRCVNTGDPWTLSAGDALNNVAEPRPSNWKILSAEVRVPSWRRDSLSRLWHQLRPRRFHPAFPFLLSSTPYFRLCSPMMAKADSLNKSLKKISTIYLYSTLK